MEGLLEDNSVLFVERSGELLLLTRISSYGAGQKEIAAACHIEPATLTSVLNRMGEKGMIERRMRNGNRRSLYVFLPGKGKGLSGGGGRGEDWWGGGGGVKA